MLRSLDYHYFVAIPTELDEEADTAFHELCRRLYPAGQPGRRVGPLPVPTSTEPR